MYAIRSGQPSDLLWLEQAAAHAAWEGLSDRERLKARPEQVAQIAATQVQGLLGSPGSLALVVTGGGWPVGFLLGTVAPDGTTGELNGLVVTLWVAPPHRRRGLATQLQAAAEEIFRQMGIRKAKVWTGLHNQAAVRLAQRRGFKPEGVIGLKAI